MARLSRAAHALLVLSATCVVAVVVRALAGAGGGAVAEALYNVGVLSACVALTLAVARPDPARAAFACGALGTVLWTTGTVVRALEPAEAAATGAPIADVLLLALDPLLCIGLVFYARSAVARPVQAMRIADATLTALTLAALSIAVVLEGMVASTDGLPPGRVLVLLGYPVGNTLLIATAGAVVALRGWAFDRRLALMAGGMLTLGTAELAYRASGSPEGFGSFWDLGWMVGALLIAAGAWTRQGRIPTDPAGAELVLPVVLGVTSLVLIVVEGLQRASSLATLGFGAAAMVALLGRMGLVLADNRRLLRASRRDAVTDFVTGLANRRLLLADLERVGHGTLVIFDLNGFKGYNDTFGHVAGDDLLRRIGEALRAAVGAQGAAYRLGGDEFCVLLGRDAAVTPAALAAAMGVHENGRVVSAAHGAVRLPEESADPIAALRLADARMYADKARMHTAALGAEVPTGTALAWSGRSSGAWC